jgi:hypothetical protein
MVETIALSESREGRQAGPGRGRPKVEVDPDHDPRQRLAWELCNERTRVRDRPSLRELAEESGLGQTTLQQAEYRTGRVSWETVQKHVEACWSLAERRGQTPVRDLQRFRDLFDQIPESDKSAGSVRPRGGEPTAIAQAPERPHAPARLFRSVRGIPLGKVGLAMLAVAAIVGGSVAGFRMLAPPRPGPAPATVLSACSTVRPCTYQVEIGDNLCLDQAVAYTPNRVDLWACWRGKNQLWIETRHGDRFTLSTQETPGRCIIATADRALTMGSCGGPASLWTATQNADDASYTFHSVAYGGMCLAVQGDAVGPRTPIVLQPCRGQAEARWM